MLTHRYASVLLLALGTSTPMVNADFQIFSPGSVENSTLVPLTSKCVDAMQASLKCSTTLQAISGSDNYFGMDTSTFSSVCSSACSTSLSSYHKNVATACAGQGDPWSGYPAVYFGDLMWSTYNYTCLQDPKTGSSCMSLFSNMSDTYTKDIAYSAMSKADLCSPCTLALWQMLQKTSYSFYDASMASQWASIQKTCSVSYPTAVQSKAATVTSIPGFAPQNYSTASCISSSKYTVKSGDNCIAISTAQGVSTGSLIALNSLLPDCSNLYAGGSLCLPQACTSYVVQSGDTCAGIISSKQISLTQLLAWNPTLDSYCSNLIAGYNLCVGVPGTTYTGTTISGASVTQTGVYATATASPPPNVAHGTTKSCGKYYTVASGDDCNLIALNKTITISMFEAINPSINSDCTNLAAGIAYCVQPTADWNSTTSSGATTSSAYVTAPAPTVSGTTTHCYEYHTVVSGDYCGLLQSEYGITFAQLQAWNPSLNAGCTNLILGDAYCVSGDDATSSTIAVQARDTGSAQHIARHLHAHLKHGKDF